MIALQAAQTLRGVAETATTVTISVFGDEAEVEVNDDFKLLYQGQLPSSAGTLYTVPTAHHTLIRNIHVRNTNAGVTKTFELFVGGTAAANSIFATTLPAGGSAVFDGNAWSVYTATGQISLVGATGAQGLAGAVGWNYKWSTSTAATDPTTGYLKLNHATPSSATALYVSETDNLANNVAAVLATYDDSNSTIRAYLKIVKRDNQAVFWIGSISAVLTDNGTWDTFTVTHVASAGSLAADDIVFLFAARTGDKGDVGNTGATGPATAGQIFLSAAGSWPRTTGGCAAAALIEMATNKNNFYVLDFDGTTKEHAQVLVGMPSDWNGGTITAVFKWTVNASVTTAVRWGLQAVSYGDNEALDVAFGTAQEVTDTAQSGVHEEYISAATSAITVAGAGASEDVLFQFYRDPANAGDTMTQDARLIGVMINFTRT